MEIITDNSSTLAPRAGEAISEVLGQYSETPVLLMFSGGSALSIIEHIDSEGVNDRVTLSVLDERFQAPESESNFAQLEATDFYAKAVANGAYAIDPRGVEGENLAETAAWFETALQSWREQHPTGIIVITQGVGTDGHTAGILPFSDHPDYFETTFQSTDRWAIGYSVPADKDQFTERITVTLPFLRDEVTSSVVYVPGGQKKQTLKALLDQPDASLAKMPARVITQMNDALLFTDQELE